MVMLKGVGADGEEAWYVHSMPVETWLMLVMGHDWGFRKDLFDMTITREKTTVMQKNGDLYMSLELTDESCPDSVDELVSQDACGGTNNMAVIHPKNPDMMLRFGWTGKGVALDDDKRAVRITVNRNLDWAGLVPAGAMVGVYMDNMPITDSSSGGLRSGAPCVFDYCGDQRYERIVQWQCTALTRPHLSRHPMPFIDGIL